MILRPVTPASPWGPPTTKRPVGFTRISASATSKPASATTGRTGVSAGCYAGRWAVVAREDGCGLDAEAEVRMGLAGAANRAAHDVGDVHLGGGGGPARHEGHAGRHERLAGDARVGIGAEN